VAHAHGAKKMTRRLVAFLLLLAVVCLEGSLAMGKESIKIGVFLPMSGNAATYGQMEWNGIRVAHSIVSDVLEREVELILKDTKSDKREAANVVAGLIKEKQVVGLIGGAVSGDALAAAAVAEHHKIPMVSPSATNPLLTQEKKYVFRVCFDDVFQGRAAARQAIIGMNAGTAAVIVDIAQEDYSVGLANLFLKAFTEMGGKVLHTSYIETGHQDFRAQLTEVLSSNPDIIYIPNYFTENALLAKQARDLGIKVPILMADGAQVPDLIRIGGKAVEGIYLTGHLNMESLATGLGQDYLTQYKKKYNLEVDGFGALAADAYFFLIDGIRRAQSTEGLKIRAALANTLDFQGISGIIKIKEDGNTAKAVVINRIKDGKFSYESTVNP
jgi:branched-chain amino acid transport system substrate-binding protein